MTIRDLLRTLHVVGALFLLALVATVLALSKTARETAAQQENRYVLYRFINKIQAAADEGTRLTRSYVQTGDQRFLRELTKGVPPHSAFADAAAFDVMQPYERAKVEQADRIAVRLGEMEREALAARAADQTNTGKDILYSDEYLGLRAKLKEGLDEAFAMIDTRTKEETALLETRKQRLMTMTLAFIACLVILEGASFIALRRKVILPIGALARDAERVRGGDLDTRAEHRSPDEVGTLAQAFNNMLERLQGIFVDLRERNTLVEEQKKRIEEQATSIAAMNRELFETVSALHQTNDELKGANEFRMKMLGMASHDLKGPLGTIRGFAELLQEQVRDDPAKVEMASLIHDSADRLLGLVRDLIDISAREMGRIRIHPAHLDVVRLLDEVVTGQRRDAAGKQQKILWDPPERIIIKADGDRLRQVFDNVVNNAVKYSPPGKGIRVALEPRAGGIEVAVRDEGPGLTEEDRARLFGYFQRLSAQPTGGEGSTGLGLALAKLITELHGGRIDAESAGPGLGSTFRVFIPSSPPNSEEGSAAEAA